MDVLTIQRYADTTQVSALTATARTHGLTNVFNASLATHASSTYVAFRAEGTEGERPFRAYVAEFVDQEERAFHDLTEIGAEYGIHKTADPKLVKLFGHIYATFNTGNVHSGTNDIFLQQITPEVRAPQRCTFAGRRMVEKNWGFLALPDGSLGVLYSLAPTLILRHTGGTLGTDDELEFSTVEASPQSGRFPRLHIGSQPYATSPTSVIVAANQQRPLPGLPRKIYFGRLAEVDLETGRLTRLSRRGLIHSWRAMLPQRRRHNPGLFSATYFAGLEQSDEDLTLTYGINDTDIGIATLPVDTAWR